MRKPKPAPAKIGRAPVPPSVVPPVSEEPVEEEHPVQPAPVAPPAPPPPAAEAATGGVVSVADVINASRTGGLPAGVESPKFNTPAAATRDYSTIYKELLEELCARMAPPVLSHFKNICRKSPKTFRARLDDVPSWPEAYIVRLSDMIAEQDPSIVEYFEFAFGAKFLLIGAAVPRKDEARVEIQTPNFERFVHRSCVELARYLRDYPNLVNMIVVPTTNDLERSRAERHVTKIANECFVRALSYLIPIGSLAGTSRSDEFRRRAKEYIVDQPLRGERRGEKAGGEMASRHHPSAPTSPVQPREPASMFAERPRGEDEEGGEEDEDEEEEDEDEEEEEDDQGEDFEDDGEETEEIEQVRTQGHRYG